MAYNKGNNYQSNGYGSGYNNRSYAGNTNQRIEAEALPAEYVDTAEQVMQSYMAESSRKISTSKLRNLLSLFVDAYNVENLRSEEKLLPESSNALTMARIRMLYESGRDSDVKAFVERAKLIPYLKDIGKDREKMICYYHYLEALVAYHRYYGGREN